MIMNDTLETLLNDKELWADFEDCPTVEEIRKNHVFTDFDKDPEFVFDCLKGFFVADIYFAMNKQGINKKELAEKLGKSKQYVGRVLNENANFTLKSLAEIACALDMNVEARLYPRDEHIVFEKINYTLNNQPDMLHSQATSTAALGSTVEQYTTNGVKLKQSYAVMNTTTDEGTDLLQVDRNDIRTGCNEEDNFESLAA